MAILKFTLFWIVFIFVLRKVNTQRLRVDYYKSTCPSLETVVNATTAKFISRAPSLAPAMLRLHFHDCFVRGCDGSVLINSTRNNTAEKDSVPNRSLRGFQVIDAVKSAVEKRCSRTVSCADILALVARDAVALIDGPSWPVPLGRRDGRVSNAAEALRNLPPPFFNITQLIAIFASKSLSIKDLVVLSVEEKEGRVERSLLLVIPYRNCYAYISVKNCLSGAHTIGISHCSSISTRLHNFTGRGDSDPSMDTNYVNALKKRCSPNDATSFIQMDPGSSQVFDTDYYEMVSKRRGLFQSDAALLNNQVTNTYIQQHSDSSGTSSFFKDFGRSMRKMGKIGVLTGGAGEIRKICSVVN